MGSNLSKKAQERIQTAKKNKSNEINLSDCQLKKLPHVVRTSLKNLTILRLSHNYLTFLPPSIANFVDLEEFYVDTNELTNLPKELFTLVKLRVLNIAHNQIATLPDEFISKLVALQTLDVSGNPMPDLPASIVKLSATLRHLYYAKCQLNKVPFQVWDLKNLRTLDLSVNQLSEIPPQIASLVGLEKLDISGNRNITKLDAFVADLSQLTSLNANDISTFPISKLVNLQELFLSECSLQRIPSEIGVLTKLVVLDLSINKLKRLPRQLGHIGGSLRKLKLRQNDLEELPGELTFFDPTIDLELASNPLKHPFITWYEKGTPVLIEELIAFVKAWGPNCECSGAQLTASVVKQPSSFFIHAKDFKGKNRINGGDRFEVVIVREPSPDEKDEKTKYLQVDAIVKDLKNGTYEVFYNCPVAGKYRVAVTCEGVPVKGSPFTLEII